MSDEYIHVPVAPKRKYTGEYIGTIETGVHDKYLRVQVRVLGLFDGADGRTLFILTHHALYAARP